MPSHHLIYGSVSNKNKYTLDPGMTTFRKEEKTLIAPEHIRYSVKNMATFEIIRFGRLSITASFKIE